MADASDHNEFEDHTADLGNEILADGGQENGDGFYDYREEYEWDNRADLALQERQLSRQEVDEALEDELGPERAKEMYELRNHIVSDQDRMNARAFKLRQMSNISRKTFDQRFTFQDHLTIDSLWVIQHRFSMLTEIEPILYDCCINLCLCYVGKYEKDTHCRFCNEPRKCGGMAQQTFSYLPLIPQLQGYFQSKKKIEALSYRSNFIHSPGNICDVFDSDHYQHLLATKVTVDGHQQPYCYFDSPTDIAFSFCSDGYLLFKCRRGGPSATPLILQIHNLSPTTCIHGDKCLSLGIIPGPYAPKDKGSFLTPFDDECAQLAYGVRNVTDGKTNYYVLLAQPSNSGDMEVTWDPASPPMCTHESFETALKLIRAAPTKKHAGELSMHSGINQRAALHHVSSVDLARCYPWDWMHLFLENIVPALVKLWMGKFKGLDAGQENYELEEDVWEIIGQEGVDAMRHIPSSFVRSVPNIYTSRSEYTAEAWGFWIMYLAPILLHNRFPDAKYHTHLCELVDIMETCLLFKTVRPKIDVMRAKIHQWVRDYEDTARIVWRRVQPQSTGCCISPMISYTMDQYGLHGPFIWSANVASASETSARRALPGATLANQLCSRYDLEDELAVVSTRVAGGLSRGEKIFDDYSNYALHPPRQKTHQGDVELRRMIAAYLKEIVLGGNLKTINSQLPDNLPLWGKVHITDGGDSIRSNMAKSKRKSERDMSYVRFELVVHNAHKVLYGRLERIVECHLPDHPAFGIFRGTLRLLAHITPCKTDGKDAAKELTFYDATTAPIITDLAAVKAVIGRARTAKTAQTYHWGIVDRSLDRAQLTFEDGEDESEGDDD
ncbi:hypothetical protein FIBSPDRAFT_903954 [Athelia psychrophila]|uniref:Transposase domain-containing protein n=1 Tax=Athelia psychrophila TaxID=1759441 RepID=A0A167VCN6_9AGAM|nr:hypothetical protein FIBSPDRAFT_903954 [Fibularhizoctonia sp. CBS 109695]